MDSEWHPWLKLFTILAIPAGLMFSIGGWASLSTGDSTGLPLLAVGIATILASVYALQTTDFYRRWNIGISSAARLAAYLAIYMGVMLTLALFFVAPFMRFITDAVGGGHSRDHSNKP